MAGEHNLRVAEGTEQVRLGQLKACHLRTISGTKCLTLYSGAPRLGPHGARGLRRLQPLQQHLHREALPRSRL